MSNRRDIDLQRLVELVGFFKAEQVLAEKNQRADDYAVLCSDVVRALVELARVRRQDTMASRCDRTREFDL